VSLEKCKIVSLPNTEYYNFAAITTATIIVALGESTFKLESFALLNLISPIRLFFSLSGL